MGGFLPGHEPAMATRHEHVQRFEMDKDDYKQHPVERLADACPKPLPSACTKCAQTCGVYGAGRAV